MMKYFVAILIIILLAFINTGCNICTSTCSLTNRGPNRLYLVTWVCNGA